MGRTEALKSFAISKSEMQGVWDPAHSTRMGIIAHSTRVGIPSGCRHFHPDVSHPEFYSTAAILSGCLTSEILLPPPFHLDVSHPEFCYCRHYIRNSDAGWERRAFQLPRSDISRSADSAYPENFTAILHSVAVFS